MTGVRGILGRFRWLMLAPVLALLALSAWAFASPIGAAPDDDYHLVSIWCANGGSSKCGAGSSDTVREVSNEFRNVVCYVLDHERSAECQSDAWAGGADGTFETDRGNFQNEYPPVYYAVMRIFAGDDLQVSALVMRLFNAVLFVGLATALFLLVPHRRRTLLWAWLVTLIPLGIFLLPSNNPSGWAVTGVGTAFLALLGWFETEGRRRWALAALYIVGVIMAAGARADAAVYVAGATIVGALITAERTRDWAIRAILPAAGLLVAILLFFTATQSGVATHGFTSDDAAAGTADPGSAGTEGLSGAALLAYNLLQLPFLWTGVWGSWGLGWFDTTMPAIVLWASVAAFIVVAFAGLGRLTWRKAIAAAGVLLVLVLLPPVVLTAGGDMVGDQLQPRYLLPLIVLLAFVLVTETPGGPITFTRIQTIASLGALGVANLVALQINIRRYVTGVEHQGLNLDAGAQWWWQGFPVGPTAVWVVGALAYAGLLAVLWPQLRRARQAAAVSAGIDA
jgi:hypothetical protein